MDDMKHHIRGHQNEIAKSELRPPASDKFVDLHCHCLPNLDDGPESIAEAVALCAALADDHIGAVVATPHQLGRFETRTHVEVVRKATGWLNQVLRAEGIDLNVPRRRGSA
jgi:protein-tyrosine phosphatase